MRLSRRSRETVPVRVAEVPAAPATVAMSPSPTLPRRAGEGAPPLPGWRWRRSASGQLRLDEGDAPRLSEGVSVAAGVVFGGGDHVEGGDDLDDQARTRGGRRVELEAAGFLVEPDGAGGRRTDVVGGGGELGDGELVARELDGWGEALAGAPAGGVRTCGASLQGRDHSERAPSAT